MLAESVDVSRPDVQAIRAKGLPANERLAAIADATRLVLDKRGHLTADDVAGLEARGVTRAKLYEIVAGACLKSVTNWLAHIEDPEIDEQFQYGG